VVVIFFSKALVSSWKVTSYCILQRTTATYCILLHPITTKETKVWLSNANEVSYFVETYHITEKNYDYGKNQSGNSPRTENFADRCRHRKHNFHLAGVLSY